MSGGPTALRSWRGVLDDWVLPSESQCDQESAGTITPSNPGSFTTATAAEVSAGTYDIGWTNNAFGDGVREMAGISWPLSELFPGADYDDPGWVFVTRLTLVDLSGVDMSSGPQFGFGIGMGTLGSGSEDGRVGGVGYASASAAAPTIRFTTGQAFSGTIALGTYPIDGAEVVQLPARANGAQPMFASNECRVITDNSGVYEHYRIANANYPNSSTTISPAGTRALFLLWASSGTGAGTAAQSARVKIEVRAIPWRATL